MHRHNSRNIRSRVDTLDQAFFGPFATSFLSSEIDLGRACQASGYILFKGQRILVDTHTFRVCALMFGVIDVVDDRVIQTLVSNAILPFLTIARMLAKPDYKVATCELDSH
ncbi:MAG: hypothetical protein DI540_11610 [Sphingobium sp.]|nr:MAG: hypothetical protein DI540_11610 [Sphingobium sp.]